MPNKLILSKKGFDSENGGGPSPILADGRMVPLPIPEDASNTRYSALTHDVGSYADLLRWLGYIGNRYTAAHVDPDLVPTVRPRLEGWRGLFGQAGSAASHLNNEGVGSGSLFLFWGWYEHVNTTGFSRSQGFSAIYGYMEVAEVLSIGVDTMPAYAADHAHLTRTYPQPNQLYVGTESLSWNPSKPGWGVFKYHDGLRLSVDGPMRSLWRLPNCFHPDSGCRITFLGNREQWRREGNCVTVQIPARGQEFVCTPSDDITAWARSIVDETECWADSLAFPKVIIKAAAQAKSASAPVPRTPSSQPSSAGTGKPLLDPLPGERLVSYGDRLLWHQLGLQLNGHHALMLTEKEYVEAILRHYPGAVVPNLHRYRSYFNNRHKSMGFREAAAVPVPAEFAPGSPDR